MHCMPYVCTWLRVITDESFLILCLSSWKSGTSSGKNQNKFHISNVQRSESTLFVLSLHNVYRPLFIHYLRWCKKELQSWMKMRQMSRHANAKPARWGAFIFFSLVPNAQIPNALRFISFEWRKRHHVCPTFNLHLLHLASPFKHRARKVRINMQ